MIWWSWNMCSAWTCMCMTYKKQKPVTSQLGWYDVPSTATRRPWISICMKTTSATSVIWRSTVTATCVRNVIGCGNMLACCTDMNVPVRGVLSTSILVVCTRIELPMTLRRCYSHWQTTFREVGMDQSSCTTQCVCVFQRSYLYHAHLLCFRRWYQWDGGVMFTAFNRYQRTSFSLTGAKVWNGIWRNSPETRPRLGRVQRRWRKKHHLYQLKQQLERYLQELPLVGFNTGKYDVNAMKVDFLLDCWTVTRSSIPWNRTTFSCASRQRSWSFSYSQYLKAYKCTEQKGFFSYEWMTSLDKLNVGQLPPHEAFFSTLKIENIQLCLHVWQENDMKTMHDFLVWYNNKDVEPMMEAIDKIFQFNQNRLLICLKTASAFPDSSCTCSKTYQITSPYRMRRIKICTTCSRTTSLVARASSSIVTTRKTRPSYDLPSTQIQSPVSWFMV